MSERVRIPSVATVLLVRYASNESCSLEVERKMGGKFSSKAKY